MKWLRSLLRILVASYVGLVAVLAGCQRDYIYFPRRAEEAALMAEAKSLDLRPWRNASGERIGWMRQAEGPSPWRVLVFHGNAGCAVDRSYLADAFARRTADRPWSVYIVEYPGYGSRPGRPSEAAIRTAALEALGILWAEDNTPILVLGESLGSGAACRLAADRPESVRGLLLLTPFDSMVSVAAIHYPWLPVRWLLRDRYDSVAALRQWSGPLVIVTAERDEVVPARLGRALYQSFIGPKRYLEQPHRDHNTLDLDPRAPWWDEALEFLLSSHPR